MKNIAFTAVIAALTLAALPAISRAASFDFINLQGAVQTIQADNANMALSYIAQNRLSVHSGVVRSGILTPGQVVVGGTRMYTYVTVNGSLKTIQAASLDAASVLATDRHPQSGFMVK